jgi:bifunctional oligoribonuclease and PAP phosphatase NrnA
MSAGIQAVVLVRGESSGDVRVSLRSKGATDVRLVAAEFGGGGHTNASGFTRHGDPATIRRDVVDRLTRVLADGPVPARG